MKNFNWLDEIIEGMRIKKIINLIPKNCTLLDFGCGDDYNLLLKLKPHIKKGIGIDAKIKNTIKENNLIINSRTKEIKDKSIDCVISLAVLEHLERPLAPFLELKRIIKPNGKIMITTPSPSSKPLLEFMAFKLKIINAQEIKDHKHYFSKRDLEKIFKKAGFKKIRIKKFQFGLNQRVVARRP